jgi:hypothetical protein
MEREKYRQEQLEDVQFKYKFDSSNNLVVVEIISAQANVSHEKIAAAICLLENISPMKMIYLVQEGVQWQMLQFSDFYNGKCAVITRTLVDKGELRGFL